MNPPDAALAAAGVDLTAEGKAIRAARLGAAIRFCVFAQVWRDHDANPHQWARAAWNAGFRNLGALALLYQRKRWQDLLQMLNRYRYLA